MPVVNENTSQEKIKRGSFASFDEFLGLDSSPLDLPKYRISNRSSHNFILWAHHFGNVPTVEKIITSALKQRPLREVLIFMEHYGLSPKEMVGLAMYYSAVLTDHTGKMLETYRKDVLQKKGFAILDSYLCFSIVEMCFTLRKQFGVPVHLVPIDLALKDKNTQTHDSNSELPEQEKVISNFSRSMEAVFTTPHSELKERFSTSTDLLAHLCSEVERGICACADRLLTNRNRAMIDMLQYFSDSISEEVPAFTLLGSAHAGVAFEFCNAPGFAFQFISCSGEIGKNVPQHFDLSFPGSINEHIIMKHAQGEIINVDDLHAIIMEHTVKYWGEIFPERMSLIGFLDILRTEDLTIQSTRYLISHVLGTDRTAKLIRDAAERALLSNDETTLGKELIKGFEISMREEFPTAFSHNPSLLRRLLRMPNKPPPVIVREEILKRYLYQ